jgi:hypothetical protein
VQQQRLGRYECEIERELACGDLRRISAVGLDQRPVVDEGARRRLAGPRQLEPRARALV